MENKIQGIYKITSPSGRIYIGQSVDIIKRKTHYSKLNCKKQIRVYNSILKHGWENHTFEIIEECSLDKLNERERYWQDYYDVLGKSGLNCRMTGANNKTGHFSFETRLKMSKQKKGKKLSQEHKNKFKELRKGDGNPMFGKKHSEETKKKLSEKRKGQFSGENHPMYGVKRNGKLNPMYGKKHSKETREKMSLSRNGKNICGKLVLNINTGVFYKSGKEASLSTNMKFSTLRSMLNGFRKNKTPFRYV